MVAQFGVKIMNDIQRRYILHRLRNKKCRITIENGKSIVGYPNNYSEGDNIYINQRRRDGGRQINERQIVMIEISEGKKYRRVL